MKTNFPNGKISKVTGKCIVLKGDDIDTDRIIPARFLKCVNFNSLGEQVFADDRIELTGNHPFDKNHNQGASILIVNDNFGCGSSREHAPQALMRWGIRGIIGQSFAEIFYGNCLALGIPCAIAPSSKIKTIQASVESNNKMNWILDLQQKTIQSPKESWSISIEKGPLEMLLSGKWDATSQLIAQEKKLTEVMYKLPYIKNFK